MNEAENPQPIPPRSSGELTPANPWNNRPNDADMQQVYETSYRLARSMVREKAAEYAAEHDELTNLLKRKALLEHIDNCLSHQQPGDIYALVFVDADNFKAVNDTHPGKHQEGDAVLRAIAGLLQKDVRQENTLWGILSTEKTRNDEVARLGGDEFVIFLQLASHNDPPSPSSNLTPEERLERFIARQQTNFQRFIDNRPDLADLPYPLGLSMGALIAEPGQTGEELLHRADQEMQKMKADHHEQGGSYR